MVTAMVMEKVTVKAMAMVTVKAMAMVKATEKAMVMVKTKVMATAMVKANLKVIQMAKVMATAMVIPTALPGMIVNPPVRMMAKQALTPSPAVLLRLVSFPLQTTSKQPLPGPGLSLRPRQPAPTSIYGAAFSPPSSFLPRRGPLRSISRCPAPR